MTAFHDLFVGLLAVAFGCLLIIGAAVDFKPLMELSKSRLLIESLGRVGARCVIAAFGLVSITLGVLIASGWRIHW
jgi:hypothetical protein